MLAFILKLILYLRSICHKGHSQEGRKIKSRQAFMGGVFKAELVFGH